MSKIDDTEQKQYNRLQRVLFTILIALLLTLLVSFTYLSITDKDFWTKTKGVGSKIPFVSELFEKDEAADASVVKSQQTTTIKKLEAEMDDKQTEIETLEKLIDTRDQTIKRNELEYKQLTKVNEELSKAQEENKRAFAEIVKTYETISAKKAAPILTQMDDTDAVAILASLKTDKLASIMEQMSPDDAARLTKLLTVEMKSE